MLNTDCTKYWERSVDMSICTDNSSVLKFTLTINRYALEPKIDNFTVLHKCPKVYASIPDVKGDWMLFKAHSIQFESTSVYI